MAYGQLNFTKLKMAERELMAGKVARSKSLVSVAIKSRAAAQNSIGFQP